LRVEFAITSSALSISDNGSTVTKIDAKVGETAGGRRGKLPLVFRMGLSFLKVTFLV